MSSVIYVELKNDVVRYNSHVMSKHLDKLLDAMEKAGMSQSELARRVGVTRGSVNHWITGRTAISMEHLIKVAKVLNMSTSEILGDDVLFAENKTERDTIKAMREMSEEEQAQLLRMAQLLAADQQD